MLDLACSLPALLEAVVHPARFPAAAAGGARSGSLAFILVDSALCSACLCL